MQRTFAQDTHTHTHTQQIIIIYTSMATDKYSRITAFKNELIKGENEEANKVIESYRFCNFILSPPENDCPFKGKEAHYLLSTLLCTDFLP